MGEDALGDAGERGCLLTNSAVELAPHDSKVRQRVNESFRWLEDGFERAVVRGQESGEIPPDRSAQKIAGFLLGTVQGLCVIGKTDPSRRCVSGIVAMTLLVLE